MNELVFLTLLIFVAAVLYSSVGHAGASGYLAAMALFGLAPQVMRPSALTLNILVAAIATVRFYREGYFSWRLFWPFAVVSVPFAFAAGGVTLPPSAYKPLVGLVLLFAAYRLLVQLRNVPPATRVVPLPIALILGAGIGLLAGLTGVGGGIFLSPILLLAGWATTRQASAVAAPFILVNSVSGMLGQLPTLSHLPPAIPVWAAAAVVGGLIGSELGARRLDTLLLRRLLAVVLVIAALKLVFG